MNGVDPRYLEVIEWTDYMIPVLTQRGADVGRLESPDQWQEWARSVILSNNRYQATAPNPYQFYDWREWAERFLQVMD
jgi:hypothetical protein